MKMKSELEQFKQWRKRKKLTQSAAAMIVGVSVDTVRGWEQGKSQPSGLAKCAIRIKCK